MKACFWIPGRSYVVHGSTELSRAGPTPAAAQAVSDRLYLAIRNYDLV
jgi:hypothetical protein